MVELLPKASSRPRIPRLFVFLALGAAWLLPFPAPAAQDAGLAAVWKDGETRTSYSAQDNRTTRFLALLPSCDSGSPTITFASTFQGREVKKVPDSIELRADLGIHVSPNFMRRHTLRMIVDDKSNHTATIDVSDSMRPALLQTPGEVLDNASASLDIADFIRLVTAHSVAMDVFGVHCTLSPDQIKWLQQFSTSVLPGR